MSFKKSNIVQITDEEHPWFAVLLVITEVKDDGIRGYTVVPIKGTYPDHPNQVEEIFVKNEQIEAVGDSIVVLKTYEEYTEDQTEMTDDVRKGKEE